MRIPKDERPGEVPRLKGSGYVEFEDRDSLLNALVIPDTVSVSVTKRRGLIIGGFVRRRLRTGGYESKWPQITVMKTGEGAGWT